MRLAALRRGGGLRPKRSAMRPTVRGLRNPPHNKIASAAVISTRSIRALSRLKSTAETKKSASKGIRVTLVIVAINSSLRLKDRFNSNRVSLLPTASQVLIDLDQSYKLIRLSLSQSQLGIEVIGFIGKHFEVTGSSTSITHLR